LLLIALPAVFEILGSTHIGGHEFDISGSRDVINHVTIGFPIDHFLLLFLWNQAAISNGFRYIQWRMWRNGSRLHVTLGDL